MNLNNLHRQITDMGDNTRLTGLKNPAASVSHQGCVLIEAEFRNLDHKLIEKIRKADAVVGCVAWLTHADVLKALEKKSGVSIIIQKEEFLRPDLDATGNWGKRLREQYATLKPITFSIEGWYEILPSEDDPPLDNSISLEAIRCVGHCPGEMKPAIPRMHHKFLVFCKEQKDFESMYVPYEPYAVWTGSFNITANSVSSLENAVYIENRDIASAYYSEWEQLVSVSKALDWTVRYAEPQLQFNTGACIS